ncbi:unnamed protein product [Durusdinium trenchii]|uniref:Mitochondrial carrier protein n=1 Tax=Durusdinium trenchii TaxID=1381693 RepID=A0ABP0SY50_9DINO
MGDASPGVHSLAGAFAGAAQTAFWHPLDVLKTRMQVRDGTVGSVHAYSSLRKAVLSTLHSEGPRGFFRGVCANVAGSTLSWGLQMPLYQHFKAIAYKESKEILAAKDSACSLAAGLATNVVVHPVFLIKTRLQLQRGQAGYRGILHAVTTIAGEEGLQGFYRGFVPSLMLSSHGAILLVAYEPCAERVCFVPTPRFIIACFLFQDRFKNKFDSVLLASGSAKVFATVATYPLQVIRSVMQQRPTGGTFEYSNIFRTGQLLWQRNGVTAFYRGILPQMMRTVPQSMAFFSIYEYALTALRFLGTKS